MPPRKQHVALLLAKAAQEEYVLDKLLDDSDAPVEIFGFHAQQTAEKLLKAILCHAGIEYPLTHQLVELLDLARCPAGRRTAGIRQSRRAPATGAIAGVGRDADFPPSCRGPGQIHGEAEEEPLIALMARMNHHARHEMTRNR